MKIYIFKTMFGIKHISVSVMHKLKESHTEVLFKFTFLVIVDMT